MLADFLKGVALRKVPRLRLVSFYKFNSYFWFTRTRILLNIKIYLMPI